MSHTLKQTQDFLKVVRQLRKKCPWDKKQTHQTLIKYLIEETYEVIDALERKNWKQTEEELGDLFLQIALHCEIASEKKRFTLESVSKKVKTKMIERHPHIFSNAKIRTAEEQTANWEKIKAKKRKSLLEGIPQSLPALQLAQKYGEKAAQLNFDWPDISSVFDKVKEELSEFEIEMKRQNKEKMKMELGDLLFTITRLASKLGIDSEEALRTSSKKFKSRFSKLEKKVKTSGFSERLTLSELDKVWAQIKQEEAAR